MSRMLLFRRNLQRPFHILLPQHVPEIQFRNTGLFRHPRRLLGKGNLSIQPRCQLPNRLHRNDGGASGKGGLRRVFRRDEEGLYPLPLGSQSHRQHTGDGTNLPVQAHLAQKGTVRSGTADAAAGGKNAQKNRKIIMGARFLLAGRSQIHGNPADRKAQAAAFGRRPNSLPGLFHRRVRQANNVESGKAVGDEALRRNQTSLNSGDAQCFYAANHRNPPFLSPLPLIIMKKPPDCKNYLRPRPSGNPVCLRPCVKFFAGT